MGCLRDLSSQTVNVHLLATNSNLAEIYVYDTLKGVCSATNESIIEVSSKSEFNDVVEFANVEPFLADKWLFVIHYKKVKSLLKKYLGIFQSTTSKFLILVENYKEFLEFKELKVSCNDMYLSVIRQQDILYLLAGYKISQKVLDFICKTYRQDPDKIFELKKALDGGIVVETTKDVVSICGESASSTVRFVMLLLNEVPTSERGLKMVFSKRIKLLVDLISSFGARKTYNFVTSTVQDILDLKILYLSGVIYDSVRELPVAYDEKKLSRYNYYLRKITTDLPYERILRLLSDLKECGRWNTTDDAIQFIYKYYLNAIKMEVA